MGGALNGQTCAGIGHTPCCERTATTAKTQGSSCKADGECLSGHCKDETCISACELAGEPTVCTSRASCTEMNGVALAESCAGSTEGTTCCDVRGAR